MVTRVVIVAAGSGSRFRSDIPKQFVPLGTRGLPVLMHTVRAFLDASIPLRDITLVIGADMLDFWQQLCRQHGFVSPDIVCGGRTRYESVSNALAAMPHLDDDDLILVHDGARPLVSTPLIADVASAAARNGAAVPVVPVTDSLRRQDSDGQTAPVDRNRYLAVQTPQAFRAALLRRAYSQPYRPSFTDDASLVDALPHPVDTVAGDPDNIKITLPRDLLLARLIIDSRKSHPDNK